MNLAERGFLPFSRLYAQEDLLCNLLFRSLMLQLSSIRKWHRAIKNPTEKLKGASWVPLLIMQDSFVIEGKTLS